MEGAEVRGQVSAPIELFVAVIILAMSMGLAFTVINQTETGKCIAVVKSETQKLQLAMYRTSIGSSSTTEEISYNLPDCGSLRVDALRFVYYKDARYCSLCPSRFGGCWQIVPIYFDKDGTYRPVTDAITCINMPGNIFIEDQSGPDSLECSNGIALTHTPCPTGVSPEDCAAKSGIPITGSNPVWLPYDERDSSSTWRTFAKQGPSRAYSIKLTKSEAVQGSDTFGQINVCVKPY